MNPTLSPGEWVWIHSFFQFRKRARPGEVAIFWYVDQNSRETRKFIDFRSPKESGGLIIKRIVACEGDQVYPRDGGAPITIPRGHVWIEGDNGARSLDSNDYGPVSKNINLQCIDSSFRSHWLSILEEHGDQIDQ